MNILYHTSGATGTGRLVRGLTIATALRRRNIQADFSIVSGSTFGFLAESLGVKHTEIPFEDADLLSEKNFHSSQLFKAITELNPDVLIIDLVWLSLCHMLSELPGKKIFLSRQVNPAYFRARLGSGTVSFDPSWFDMIIRTEPFELPFPSVSIGPMILRNRDEIFSRDGALRKLGLPENERYCLVSHNGEPGEFGRISRDFSYLKDAGYHLTFSSNYHDGLFPAVDCFNAFDHLVCGAGYNSFWEAVYFGKDATFVAMPRRFEDQALRVSTCSGYRFDENGADQLADIIMSL